MAARPITLSSDFGTTDWYVGAMKGVLTRDAPDCRLIDLLHDIPAHDASAGAFALAQAVREFPVEAVHLCVVDPGVGGARRAIALRDDRGRHFVGPDNGVLLRAASTVELAVELPVPAAASPTFHGRDVFAPAAARLGMGEALANLGTPIADLVQLAVRWSRVEAEIHAPIIWVDRFGNLISDLPASELPARFEIVVEERRITSLHTRFDEVRKGALLAYVGSAGTLEIAINQGRASDELPIGPGGELRIAAR